MSGLICAGNVYLDLYVDGARTGEFGPINCTKFSLSPGKADSIDRVSFLRDTFGNALDSVVFPGISTLTIESDDAGAETLQYAMLGTLSDIDAAQGQITAGSPETATLRFNKWTKLAHRKVSSVVVKDSGSATATVTTDYIVDATAGMIKPVSTSAVIADGEVCTVTYNYGALTSAKQIVAATSTEVRAFVRLDGKNLATQQAVEIICPQAVLVPSGELDVAGKKFVTFTMSGTLVTYTGYSGPYIYKELTATSYA